MAIIVALLAMGAVATQSEVVPFYSRLLAACTDADSEAGCKCGMGCKVMGGDNSGCSSDKAKNEKLGQDALTKVTTGEDPQVMLTELCAVMECLAYCSKKIGCGQEQMKAGCEDYKKTDTTCEADCTGGSTPDGHSGGGGGDSDDGESGGAVSPFAGLGLTVVPLMMAVFEV